MIELAPANIMCFTTPCPVAVHPVTGELLMEEDVIFDALGRMYLDEGAVQAGVGQELLSYLPMIAVGLIGMLIVWNR
jgi:hypothetical protein